MELGIKDRGATSFVTSFLMPDPTDPLGHYDRIAADYDRYWAHDDAYVQGMSERMISLLRVEPGHRVADIGGGTGIYSELLGRVTETPVYCVDPSQAMLAVAATKSNVLPVPATAQGMAVEMARRGLHDKFDALLLRHVVHHLEDPQNTVAELIDRHLVPGGRALVVCRPPGVELPLFSAARKKWEELEPDPVTDLVTEGMRDSGLDVTISHLRSTIRISRDRYLEMVKNRFISLLSFFDDDELKGGIEEMATLFSAEVSFVESRVFMVGEKRSPEFRRGRVSMGMTPFSGR